MTERRNTDHLWQQLSVLSDQFAEAGEDAVAGSLMAAVVLRSDKRPKTPVFEMMAGLLMHSEVASLSREAQVQAAHALVYIKGYVSHFIKALTDPQTAWANRTPGNKAWFLTDIIVAAVRVLSEKHMYEKELRNTIYTAFNEFSVPTEDCVEED